MAELPQFIYEEAFARNLGWLTEAEQLALRGKSVAIAGLGGVGGAHLLTLVRLGIGAFRIADFDRFSLPNFNRQVGATMGTIGRPKIDVLEEMALAINPTLILDRFPAGVKPENIDDFLAGADIFVDGLDFFALGIRRHVFKRCSELGIAAVTAAPIGMGTCFLVFEPGGMTFEEYFRLAGCSDEEKYLRFLIGLSPKRLSHQYLIDDSYVDLSAMRTPSTAAACQLCAGVTAVMVTKLLLRRSNVRAAPFHHHYDAYREKLVVTRLRFGNVGPLQQIKLKIGQRILTKMSGRVSPVRPVPASRTVLEEILNAARWAPSGDNKQPWKFEVTSDSTLTILVGTADGTNIYEYRDGEPLMLAAGMLLESIRIAATAHGRAMTWQSESSSRINVTLTPQENIVVDPLNSFLPLRTVDRWPYRWRRLTTLEATTLESVLEGRLLIEWHSSLPQRWRFARLCARSGDIRLRLRQAYEVHAEIIDWERKLSPRKIPAGALGVVPATRLLMRWALRSWGRVKWINRIFGTKAITFQMDYIPILWSAACFTMCLPKRDAQCHDRDSLLEAGIHIQRFWLTATRLGLAMQPLLSTLIFADYGSKLPCVIGDSRVVHKIEQLGQSFKDNLGHIPSEMVFLGRIGKSSSSSQACRSTRMSLEELTAFA